MTVRGYLLYLTLDPSNSVFFLSSDDSQLEPDPEPSNKDQTSTQQYGCGQRTRHQKGHYKAMNLVTAITAFTEEPNDNGHAEFPEDSNESFNEAYEQPPDIALVGFAPGDPRMLEKALCGPDAKQWQEALDYEIGQLEKLGTWDMVDLPKGHTPIPCSKVVWVKQGPNGEIQSYRLRIVAGGHRQTEGVNYTETSLATTKMPTVHVVLANAATQETGN